MLFLWLCRYWKGSTFKPLDSCCYGCAAAGKLQLQLCCGCAITGKCQLSSQWLTIVVAVPLLETRTNGWLLMWLCHYWKWSTLEPMVSCCCGCAITGKGQLLNQWLAVVVAVLLLATMNSRLAARMIKHLSQILTTLFIGLPNVGSKSRQGSCKYLTNSPHSKEITSI
jgi:TM2 domain-containing membrane protein YozV